MGEDTLADNDRVEKNLVFKDWSSKSLGLSKFFSPNLGLVGLRGARMSDLALNWCVTSCGMP